MSASFTNARIQFSNNNNNIYEYNSLNGTYNDPNGNSLVLSGQQNIFFNTPTAFVFSANNGQSASGGCIYALGYTNNTIPVYYKNNGYAFVNNNSQGQGIGTSGQFNPNWYNSATAPYSYNTNSSGAPYSLVCGYRILCNDEIDVCSDKRIKQNINPLLSNESLNIIRKIEPVSYNHKDCVKRGFIDRFGFIAQDIKDILPSCVNIIKEFIPNIYENVEILNKNIIKLNQKNKSDFYIKDAPIKLKIFLLEKETNKEFYKIYTVNKFIDDKTIEINEEIDFENVFLFGQEVDDFHVLNYDDINIINISAVKKLDEEVQQLKETIKNQQSQIEYLMNEINNFKNLIK
jgi:hypothetical protein